MNSRGANRPKPAGVGRPAPEWRVGAWSDGKPRKLADLKGKVVFLDFWGILIDPAGKIAFSTDEPSNGPKIEADMKQKGLDPKTMIEEQSNELMHQSVGSSRVDLQACKLEYSIVSPK